MQENEYQAITRDIQEIKQEQKRLREEQERLQRQAAESDGNRTDRGKSPESQQARKGDQEKQDHDKSNDNKNEKQQKDKKEEPKPPLKQRVRTYIHSHKKQTAIGAIAFFVLCVFGVFLILYLRSYESTDDAQVDGHLNAISTRITGTVQNVYVEDNQTVTAGQLLVELDPRDFQTALAQAKASYSAAEAQLKAENPNVPIAQTSNESIISTSLSAVQNAQAAVMAAEQDHQSRLAMLRQAEATDAKAQQDLVRYRGLALKEEISHEQFDTFNTTAKTQAAAVVAAQAAVQASQQAIDQSRAQLLQAQARLNEATRNAPRNVTTRVASVEARQAALMAAQAQADQASLNLSYTKVFAPTDGIVVNKTVEVGQRVEPGEQLMIVSQTEDIWITANFKETQLRKMYPGQEVDIHIDTYSREYHGYIQSMPGATGARTSLLPPENATGNFVKVVQRLPVRIRLKDGENQDHLLRPGMSVEPKVWLK